MSAGTGALPCPHGLHSCAACDRYWWHAHVVREVTRLTGECGLASANVPAIAGNLRMSCGDVERYVSDLVAWGELVPAEPAFDYAATWVRVAA